MKNVERRMQSETNASRWESNPHLPECTPGVLSRLNYGNSGTRMNSMLAPDAVRSERNLRCRSVKLDGQVAPQIGVSQSGNRTRNAELSFGGSLTVSNHPFLGDNLQASAHRESFSVIPKYAVQKRESSRAPATQSPTAQNLFPNVSTS